MHVPPQRRADGKQQGVQLCSWSGVCLSLEAWVGSASCCGRGTGTCVFYRQALRRERCSVLGPAQALDTVETDLMDRVAAEYMSQRAQHAQHLSTLPPPPGR